MTPQKVPFRLLLIGAVPRLVIATAIVALLWLGFFWATGTPGALR